MVRLPPHGKVSTQRRVPPMKQVDVEKVLANQQPHGVARPDGNTQQRGHLRGPAARVSGSAEQFQASEKHHYDPEAPSVRFSQGVVTSANGACIAHQARKRPATACRALTTANANTVMKPVPAAQKAVKPATGCVIPMGDGDTTKRSGKATRDIFSGPTLQGTSMSRTLGSPSRFQRSASLAAARKACDDAAKPKVRGTVSAEFMQAHPEPAPARTNDSRYQTEPRMQKRFFQSANNNGNGAAAKVVAPW
eukprot:CAMPEP_0174853770 /NCGR_PEP_ID=MMETSP1114-20130205/29563_1 /TAXON_ID=312471 /ORGANISM="Neobodo designis, Strain CCAP 1951/1" /LENGTH=249 /DNA_ID=CAMNT_0016088437 /DNA_START=41 /DNA_END=787 /DNA_ORIENTATION=-